MRFYVETSSALARILGVTPAAVSKARLEGRITAAPDGRFDVFGALADWRENTFTGYAKRPVWLDPKVPLTGRRLDRLVARCRSEKAVEDDDTNDDDVD